MKKIKNFKDSDADTIKSSLNQLVGTVKEIREDIDNSSDSDSLNYNHNEFIQL